MRHYPSFKPVIIPCMTGLYCSTGLPGIWTFYSSSRPATITEFDETLVKRLIAKIAVFEDHFTIDFKSGVTIDIEA